MCGILMPEVNAFFAMRSDVFLPMLDMAALSFWTESWIAGQRAWLLHFYHDGYEAEAEAEAGARQRLDQRRRKPCGAGQASSRHPKW